MESDRTSGTGVTPIRSLLRRLANVNVPRGDALTFVVLASVAVFLLVNEAITGVLLALYFRPTVADANTSVRFIITEVEFGGLVRALHYWGSNALIVVLGATVAWAVIRRAYKTPNAIAWACLVSLTFVAVLEAFTGGLLPWTHRSVVESQISSTLAGQLPFVGPMLRGLLLGGSEPGDLALVRILGVHAGTLPMIATVLVGMFALHAAGSSPKTPGNRTLPFAPHVILRASAMCAAAAIVLFALASFWSPRLGGSAEVAHATAVGLRPSWYLIFAHQLLLAAPARMLGIPSARVIATLAALLALVAVLFPALDRKASRVGQILGLVVLTTILGGTIRALLT